MAADPLKNLNMAAAPLKNLNMAAAPIRKVKKKRRCWRDILELSSSSESEGESNETRTSSGAITVPVEKQPGISINKPAAVAVSRAPSAWAYAGRLGPTQESIWAKNLKDSFNVRSFKPLLLPTKKSGKSKSKSKAMKVSAQTVSHVVIMNGASDAEQKLIAAAVAAGAAAVTAEYPVACLKAKRLLSPVDYLWTKSSNTSSSSSASASASASTASTAAASSDRPMSTFSSGEEEDEAAECSEDEEDEDEEDGAHLVLRPGESLDAFLAEHRPSQETAVEWLKVHAPSDIKMSSSSSSSTTTRGGKTAAVAAGRAVLDEVEAFHRENRRGPKKAFPKKKYSDKILAAAQSRGYTTGRWLLFRKNGRLLLHSFIRPLISANSIHLDPSP